MELHSMYSYMLRFFFSLNGVSMSIMSYVSVVLVIAD